MKTNETKKRVKKEKKASAIDEKRAKAKKNLPFIKEAIAKYGRRSAS